jgi:hypothetical protein
VILAQHTLAGLQRGVVQCLSIAQLAYKQEKEWHSV